MTKKNSEIQVVYKSVNDLIPYVNNARTHSDEQVAHIASSIKEFGFTSPILIDGENGIIAGHGRLMAAKKLGLSKVPCIELNNFSDAQKKAFILADNKLALDAGWDYDLLRVEIDFLKEADFDLDLTGFSADEILEIAPVELDEEDSEPEPVKEDVAPVSQTGDVWVCGDHRIMCGDSTDPANILILMNGEKANLYLTDPPYNVAYEGKTEDALTIENDSMSNDDFRAFLVNAFSAVKDVLKSGSSFYIWHADSEGFNFRGAGAEVGWRVRQCLVWNKNTMVMGRQDYQWKHEPCLYGWTEGTHKWYSDRSQTTVIDYNKPMRNGEHPTMKPVGLFEYLIKNSSRAGDIVLDSFGGSGTTMIACESLQRKARLMELDPKYADVIVQRWQEASGKKAFRESDNVLFDDLLGETPDAN